MRAPLPRVAAAILLAACAPDAVDDEPPSEAMELGPHRFEVRFPGYEVPTQPTTYACAGLTVSLDELAHIVAFEPVIDDRAVVHHMFIGVTAAPFDGVVPCYPSAPATVNLWGWAPGMGPFELPEEAGLLIGNAPDGQVHFVVQIHYDNAALEPGHVDHTGVNVYYTHELRPENSSVFVVGDVGSLAIPAGQPSFETIHYCMGATTAALFSEPIHVFGSWVHAHELATSIWTEHQRGGQTLGELGRNDPYRFDLQHVAPLDAWIEPGDQLVTHCIFDSTSRTEPTLGGGGTRDEMCLNYLYYAPAQPFAWACQN